MCAWGKGKDSCVGDSGGPLVVEEHGNYVLIGIVRCHIYTNPWLIYSSIIGNQQLLVVINQKLLRILRRSTPYQLRQNWWNWWNGAHYLWTWRKWRGLHQGAALRFMDSLCYGSSHNLRRWFWFITLNFKYNTLQYLRYLQIFFTGNTTVCSEGFDLKPGNVPGRGFKYRDSQTLEQVSLKRWFNNRTSKID